LRGGCRHLQADRDGLDLEEPVGRPNDGRLEAFGCQHLADLRGLHVRILEPNDPAGAAGVVDRELEARVGERGQQDEEQPGNREQG
jgi:hypothetical protein